MYSIVDIETTGGHAANNAITEIAIINFDGEKITDRFKTLISPDARIPFYITHLTGITDEMVESAPSFEEVLDQIESLTRDRVLIAHNAHFDYSFLKQAFERSGRSFNRRTLCTLRLSRKIIPGMPSYSLDKLCRTLCINQETAHRAESDAIAALELFQYLRLQDARGIIESSLKARVGEYNYPPHLSEQMVRSLPDEPGVYYFIDRSGNILYVGKAKSIRKRVYSHFSANSSTRIRTGLMNYIHKVDYQLCGNELIAMLLESSEIKKHFPPFNYAQKIADTNFGLYAYFDGKGFYRFGIKKLEPVDHPMACFASLTEVRTMLNAKVKEFHLCPRLCGLHRSTEACFNFEMGTCDGACCGKVTPDEYNQRMKKAIDSFNSDVRSFAILGDGRSGDENSVIVIENGKYLGFAFMKKGEANPEYHSVKDIIQPYRDNREVNLIINSYMQNHNDYMLVYPS